MGPTPIRWLGVAASGAYAAFIIWLYAQQPGTLAEITGGVASTVGVYRVDEPSFQDGLRLFRRDQFEAARSAFERADPARRDPTVQFYVAYSYYREGWSPFYHDDRLFRQGLEALSRASAAADGGRVVVRDPNLTMQTADELRAELEAGLRADLSDANPLRLFRRRK